MMGPESRLALWQQSASVLPTFAFKVQRALSTLDPFHVPIRTRGATGLRWHDGNRIARSHSQSKAQVAVRRGAFTGKQVAKKELAAPLMFGRGLRGDGGPGRTL
jgi:hypothetical protein